MRNLPEDDQREVYGFYLFVKQRALEKQSILQTGEKSLTEDRDKPEEMAGISIEKINACLSQPERV